MSSLGSPTGAGTPGGAMPSGTASTGGGSSASGGHSSGGGSHDFTARTYTNQQQLRYFAAAMCGIVAIFVVSHWARVVSNKLSPSSKANPIRSMSRLVRNFLVRKIPGFTSSGHLLVVAAYVAANLALTLTNVEINESGIANRCGWMLCANFVLVVFLALKNTPLAILSAYSYERLNGLHQIAGYTTFAYLVLHAAMYTDEFLGMGRVAFLQESKISAGIVAAFGFLLIIISGVIVRFIWYEIFFALHVTGFLMALIGAFYHQPDLESGIVIMFAVIAGIWGTDRLIRGGRMLFRSFNNYATLEALPDGGTKIVVAKKPLGAKPGKHCYVWIPRVRALESHPFTIAATEPMEFVVNAYDGFTRDLHKFAVANPGAKLMASVDGPYGTFPDPMAFDKVVLIAGGSGATFTFGLAGNMLEKMGSESTKNITFIWAVKKHDNLSWFASHLQTLRNHPHSPKVNVSLYVTAASSQPTTSNESLSEPIGHSSSDDEKRRPHHHPSRDDEKTAVNSPISPVNHHHSISDDPEKADNQQLARHPSRSSSTGSLSYGAIKAGRPDTATLIREAVSSTPSNGRVLVAACGPAGLMRTVRDTTASLIRGDGPAVELHCEEFGW